MRLFSLTLIVASLAAPVVAQAEDASERTAAVQRADLPMQGDTAGSVEYPAAFFDKYRPITALDMVERVPGFRIQSGGGSRGFAGAAGNILIDGERPTTKGDTVAQILNRLAASRVARIDLIRGQTGDYDVRGQSVVVNVIMRENPPLTVKWDVRLEQDIDVGDPEPRGAVSLSDRLGATSYTAGLEVGRSFFQNGAVERLLEGGAVVEDRLEFERNKSHDVTGNLNTETRLGETIVHFNGEVRYENEDGLEPSRRVPRNPGAAERSVIESDGEEQLSLEVGGDVETPLGDALSGKAIVLFSHEDEDGFSALRTLDAAERQLLFQLAKSTSEESESIARLEFDWRGLPDHTIELDLEGAFNTLESGLDLTVDSGDGPMPVPVPGSNTRVEELRGDFALSDSWQLGDLTLDSELAAETSTISQSGDVSNKRTFNFVKPNITLTHSPAETRQTRLVFRRDVAQLNFNDFVSATNFGDNDLDLGNPDLSPQSTWVLELSRERRFGEIGAVELTGFFNWLEDVEDLVPVGDRFEIVGNIGTGRRYGVELEATVPLDGLGLPGARLDLEGRWQDSSVTDAATGLDRVLSDEREFTADIDFREDFERARVAWGWTMRLRGERPLFGVDELDTFDRGVDFQAFLETTRWLGVKMRATLQNILDREFIRDRQVFDGRRGSAPEAFREFRDRRRGRSLVFEISGTF